MSEIPTNEQKSISERLSAILAQLNRDQLRFITAMQEFPTKQAAAESISLQPNTVYKWPKIVDEALDLIAQDRVESVREITRRYAIKAVMVKVAGLDADDETLRQKVATEVIEMVIGKPKQVQEHHMTLERAAELTPEQIDAELKKRGVL